MIKLSEVFSPYGVELDGSLADAAVNNIRINKERRILNIDINSDYLLTRAAIFEAQERITKADIGIDKVIIHPHFKPESFDVGYFDELVAALKSNTPSLNGTLNDAVLIREGEDRLNVELAHGGLALLQAKEFDTLLSDIIYREFGLRFDIRFSGVTQLSVDDEQFTDAALLTHTPGGYGYAESKQTKDENTQDDGAAASAIRRGSSSENKSDRRSSRQRRHHMRPQNIV